MPTTTVGDATSERGSHVIHGLAGRWRGSTLAATCAVIAVVSACGSAFSGHSGPSTSVPSGVVESLPFTVARGTLTADGDDLVAIEGRLSAGPPLRAAIRRDGGTWTDLPDLPFAGFLQLATADGRAVAGGIACTDRRCRGGELAFAMLDAQRERWIRLDAPKVALPVSETELTSAPGPAEFASFAVGGSQYLVSSEGRVQLAPGQRADGRTRTGCTVGGTEVSIDYDVVPPPDGVAALPSLVLGSDVRLRSIELVRPGELVSPPPAGVGPHWRILCAAGRFTIYDDSAEAVLDLATRTWSISPSNFIAAGGDAWPGTSIAGSGASARDGDTAFVMATGRVLSRVGDGDWSLIETNEIEVDQVFATDVAAFAVGADGRTVQEIWHR